MAEDLTPKTEEATKFKAESVTDVSAGESTTPDNPEEQKAKDESARILQGLEQQLTPEEMEIILTKLDELGDPDKEVAIRFMNSAEYLNTLANKEKGRVPSGIEFNVQTIGEIKKNIIKSHRTQSAPIASMEGICTRYDRYRK